MTNQWLGLIQRLQAIAQNGLRYSKDPYDIDRFQQLRSISADMLAALAHADASVVRGLFDNYDGTATPKIDVRAVVVRDGQVLMVRQTSEGKWTLPGGWADVGQSLSEAITKEVREEAGYIVEPKRILAVHDRPRHNLPPIPEHVWKVFVQATIVAEAKPDALETDAVGFFRVDGLPELSEGRVTKAQLARMLELAADPNAPADFD